MQTIDRQDLRQLMARQPRLNLLEVLDSEHYDEGHLPGAICLPLADNFETKAEQVVPNQSKTVVVYCQNADCDASPIAAKRLEAMGYENVYDYEGGKDDWVEAGLDLHGVF